MTGEVNPQRLKQRNKYFLRYKQLNTFYYPYYVQKHLDSEPSTFLLVNRYIIYDKFDKNIQLNMIMIYTDVISGQGPRPDINNGPGVTQIVPTFWLPAIHPNPTRIMAPLQAIPILGQMEDTPV